MPQARAPCITGASSPAFFSCQIHVTEVLTCLSTNAIRQALTPRLLWEGLKEYDLWPLYAIGLLFGIPGYPLGNYFQISMSRWKIYYLTQDSWRS